MGYAAVFSIDDRTIRTLGGDAVDALAADLCGLRVRPGGGGEWPAGRVFTQAAVWHSGDQHLLVADPTGIRAVTAPRGRYREIAAYVAAGCGLAAGVGEGWVDQPRAATAGEVARAHRVAAHTGHNPVEVLWGPDVVTGRSARSVWWLYLDGFDPDPGAADLAAGIVAVVDRRFDGVVPHGWHTNAANRAGWNVGAGPVALVWSGNRLCRPGDLDDVEVDRLLGRSR